MSWSPLGQRKVSKDASPLSVIDEHSRKSGSISVRGHLRSPSAFQHKKVSGGFEIKPFFKRSKSIDSDPNAEIPKLLATTSKMNPGVKNASIAFVLDSFENDEFLSKNGHKNMKFEDFTVSSNDDGVLTISFN